MKGLGTVTVAGLIGEVGDFTKFRTQSEIMKLAGLDLYEISSGKEKGTEEDIETGKEPSSEDPLQCGHLDHTKERDHVHVLYTNLIGRGMKRTSALIVIAKKLLRIIHAIVRDDRDYIRDYESPKRVVIQKAA